LKHETFCCSDRGSAGAKRDPLQGRLRGAVQQADDMRSRRAYHESPVTFASVCLFSSCVSRPFHGQMRFSADLSMTRMGTGGYLRQLMAQKPAHHFLGHLNSHKARSCEDYLMPRGFSFYGTEIEPQRCCCEALLVACEMTRLMRYCPPLHGARNEEELVRRLSFLRLEPK